MPGRYFEWRGTYSKSIWWCNKALCLTHTEAHVELQNDRQEVSESVGYGRGVEEDLSHVNKAPCSQSIKLAHHCENPNFQIQASLEELLRVPWLRLCISTIFVDTVDDVFCFALCQELKGLVRLVWEIDQ